MTTPSDPGINLVGDLASVLDDKTFHDIEITCADGVVIGASRHLLAVRSTMFRNMLYGEMQEAKTGKVNLQNIKSDTFRIVLLFLYTGDIASAGPLSTELIIDTYSAATFFLLPKLMKLTIVQAQEITTIDRASSLLNEATAILPASEDSRELFDVLVHPFFTHQLQIGDLNTLSARAIEVLLTSSQSLEFHTSELMLLLCVIDWAWADSADTPPANERRLILEQLAAYDPVSGLKVNLTEHKLLDIVQHVDLSLICPHRMVHLVKAIDTLVENPSQFLVSCRYACIYTHCPPGHPSGFRGMPHYRWDQDNLGTNLVVSENGAVVSYPSQMDMSDAAGRSAKVQQPIVMSDGGIFEWDIVIEAIGLYDLNAYESMGIVGENFIKETYLLNTSDTWSLTSVGSTICLRKLGTNTSTAYKRQPCVGDVITFHLNRESRECTFSINGLHFCSIIFSNLCDKVYPAVTLFPQARYRLRTRVPASLPPVLP